MKRVRTFVISILFFCMLAFLIYIFLDYLKLDFIRRKTNLEEEIAGLKSEYIFFRYRIDSVENGKVGFTFYIFDPNENLITNSTILIDGSDVFLESKVIILNPTNSIVFPLRLFSDVISPAQAISLKEFYSKKRDFFYSEKSDMGKFFNSMFYYYVFGEGNIDRYKSFVKSEMDVVLHSAIPLIEGDTYECILHPGGQLELKRSEL